MSIAWHYSHFMSQYMPHVQKLSVFSIETAIKDIQSYALSQSQKIDLTLIQREIPFLPLSKRKSFLESLGYSHIPDEIFSDAIFDKSAVQPDPPWR